MLNFSVDIQIPMSCTVMIKSKKKGEMNHFQTVP